MKGMSDPYQAVVDEHFEKIAEVYAWFEEKRPVMLLDVQDKKIYAYSLDEYKKQLGERDQRLLENLRTGVSSGELMVLFVIDEKEERLVSYQFTRATQ